ncbi:MAG: hypothetical protein Q9181_006344 [Wetmoreana brouardii]
MASDDAMDLSSDSDLSSVISFDSTEDETEESKACIRFGAPTPPPSEDGISMLLSAAPLVPGPPAEDGISLLLRVAALMERNKVPCQSDRCPVSYPHGEGLYRHPNEVANSELANIFFAPSVPPPSVVEAFNNIAGMPSWGDLHIKDGFFECHTAPCWPSKHLKKMLKQQCKSSHCGISEQTHKRGIYLHNSLDPSHALARQVHHIFGLSNPPTQIWDAALRLENGTEMADDRDLVDDFTAHHGRLDDDSPAAKDFKAWQKERRNVRG